MKTFTEFTEQFIDKHNSHRDGTYVAVELDSKTSEKLFNWVTENNITNPTPKSEYHCTVVYSTKPIPEAKKENADLPFTATFDKWEVFDTQSGDKCLVARIKSDEIVELHERYHSKYDAKYDYDEYKPHVTVSYNLKGDVPTTKPDFKFNFDALTFKGLNKDWKPD